MLPQAAEDHYRQQQLISGGTMLAARRLWALLGTGDFDTAWRSIGPRLFTLLSAAQLAAARSSIGYTAAVLAELDIEAPALAVLVPASLVGVASSGASLADVLYQPVIATRQALAGGADLQAAQAVGESQLDGIVRTQVADAGRDAESVETTVRPAVTGYVRMLSLPSCSRCALLAGRFYRWNDGFLRHPRCDCRHIPADENVAGDMTTDPAAAIKSGQVTGISQADQQAIDDGSDIGRVLNARSGMSTAQVGGQKVKTTTTGTGRRRSKAVRLRPESLYKQAGGNRDEALRLLKAHGYIR
jgi:hypothetical protein